MNNLFKEYSELMNLIASLEEKRQKMQVDLINEIEADGVNERKTPFGLFTVSGRRTYEYSPAVKQLQGEVLKQKKYEESRGIAQLVKHSSFIRFSRGGEK